jgi:Protein of unknown function (DUF3152)
MDKSDTIVEGGGKPSAPRLVTFWATVASDVHYPESGFLVEVNHYLHDPAGWMAKGYKFQLQKSKPDVTFILSKDRPDLQGLSFAHPKKGIVEVNATNWKQGVSKTHLSLYAYRQYVISHEMGHMLGYEHSNPHPHGQPVPVMHQQSRLGIEGFKPNNKVDPDCFRSSWF